MTTRCQLALMAGPVSTGAAKRLVRAKGRPPEKISTEGYPIA